MSKARVSMRAGAATAFACALLAASAVAAEPLRARDAVTPDFTSVADGQTLSQPWSAPTPHKTLQLDSRGRWGVRLDMEQPAGRTTDWKDVQAGAYLKLTPRIRVGGSVGFGDKFANPQRITPEDTAPRVHLETSFKF